MGLFALQWREFDSTEPFDYSIPSGLVRVETDEWFFKNQRHSHLAKQQLRELPPLLAAFSATSSLTIAS